MNINRRTFITYSSMLGMGFLTRAPSTFAVPAAVKPAPNMPAPEFVDTNGLKMAVYEKGEGIPVVLVHGFPELAYSWRHQLHSLADAGFRVLVPDQRGYGMTGGPDGAENYTIKHLTDDLAGLLDAKGIDKAIFCGHDWGGSVVWSMARLHPERCLGVIGVNTPASRPPNLPPVENHKKRLAVTTGNYYARTFMEPERPERIMERDVEHTMRWVFQTGGNIWNREKFAQFPEDSAERRWDALTMIERGTISGEQVNTKEELQYYIDTFEVTGFTGGLNWYRGGRHGREVWKTAKWDIDVPCMYIGAEHDTILEPLLSEGMEDFIPDLERHIIKGIGHWTQSEAPDELNKLLIDWLTRRFKEASS